MTNTNPANIWAAALGQLQLSVNKPNYDTWLRDTVGLRFDDGAFVVGANNDFTTEWLDIRMRKVILQALVRVVGHPVEVSFEVARPESEVDDAPLLSEPLERSEIRRLPLKPSDNLHPALTFDTFIVGEENTIAHASALAAVAAPGRQNPLVIFGGPGLGKTHLLNAIGHAAHAAGHSIAYATAERFGTEFGTAAQHKSFEKFRRKYRHADVLLIDDIQFFESRPGFQEEFFHTFNDLHAAGKQVVVTCDRLPSQLSGLSDALRTRLMMGMQADLSRPGFTTRLAILRAKAAHHAHHLPDAALEQIAQRCCPTVRELEGYLNRVLAHVPLVGGKATPDIIERALAVFTIAVGNGHAANSDSLPTTDDIIAAVCAHTSTTRGDLTGRSRSRDVSYARHLAMYILRHDAKKTVAEIQRLFGNRDHSTVIAAITRIEAELQSRPETKEDVRALRLPQPTPITPTQPAPAPAATQTPPPTPDLEARTTAAS